MGSFWDTKQPHISFPLKENDASCIDTVIIIQTKSIMMGKLNQMTFNNEVLIPVWIIRFEASEESSDWIEAGLKKTEYR